ncbi:MAG TPA: cyanophycin synthetase, partial [Pseudogracilibacillus sp.]|nr:cyanophycin synthetase [Pseudogracilibacillus sp.]
GAWLDNEYMYFKEEPIIRLKDIVLVGDHNKQNILAAIAIAMLMGATKAGIYQVLTTFSGVEHRLQYVANKNERLFYNDSKATNMLATEKALQSFTQPIILLAGGLDRGDDYEDLVPYLNNVKEMIVFGETAEKLKTVAIKENIIVHQAIDVREAVHIAYEDSKEGDVILLSPACASWDQYKTFEERGNMFIQAVHTLA